MLSEQNIEDDGTEIHPKELIEECFEFMKALEREGKLHQVYHI